VPVCAKPSKLSLGLKFTWLDIVLFIEAGDHEANLGCGVIAAFRQNGRSHRDCTEISKAGVRSPRYQQASMMFPCGDILTQYEEQEGGDRTPKGTI